MMAATTRATPLVANRSAGVVISVGLFLFWAWFTYMQFDRAGGKAPAALRWATFW
jgi:hypothetical protein